MPVVIEDFFGIYIFLVKHQLSFPSTNLVTLTAHQKTNILTMELGSFPHRYVRSITKISKKIIFGTWVYPRSHRSNRWTNSWVTSVIDPKRNSTHSHYRDVKMLWSTITIRLFFCSFQRLNNISPCYKARKNLNF